MVFPKWCVDEENSEAFKVYLRKIEEFVKNMDT